MKDKISKLGNVFRKYGFFGGLKKCFCYFRAFIWDPYNPFSIIHFYFSKKKLEHQIWSILEHSSYDRIIIWRDRFGWNTPLFQRSQHIAENFAHKKCLVFYEVTKMTDSVHYFQKQDDNLYLVNFNHRLFSKLLYSLIDGMQCPKYIQLYSTNWDMSLDDMKGYMDQGYRIIYEYVDDLNHDLSGTKEIPQNIMDKYEFVMGHKDIYVVTTASVLYDDIVKRRGKKNLVFSSNGVDYSFYESFDEDYEFEEEFTRILEIGKPVVCYYGALAKWFDYELVKKIAKTNQYSIVLFGVKYDGAYDANMGDVSHVYFMGAKPYSVLKNYAHKTDILMIPFQINDITRSTSPVKIFEYMALHKPIVTTDMNECRKYESILIGKNHDDFLKKLGQAYLLRDNFDYIQLLDEEARDNDWSVKAQVVLDLIQKGE